MMIEQLFNKAPCGYFSFFDDGNLFVANETFYMLTGFTAEELEGKNVETFFTIPTRIFCQTHFFPMLKLHEQAEEIFITLLTKQKQQLPILLNAKRSELNGKSLTACAFIVVPNRKKFEDELVAARNAAEIALRENSELIKAKAQLHEYTQQLDEQIQIVRSQNDELRQFNNAVTHNLQEPLRKILLYTDRLQNSSNTSAETDLVKVRSATGQLRNVVEALQQYIWLNDADFKFEQLELATVLQNAIDNLSGEEKALLKIQTNTLPSIEADRSQMILLLYHLLHNAIKFRKGEMAHVSINATIVKRNKYRTVENKYKYEDYLRLEIRDEGIGFDKEHKHELFQLFQKLHHHSGRGIGLALCRMIASKHRGSIEADGEVNKFAAFTVWLPMVS